MSKPIVSNESIVAYTKRLQSMIQHKFIKKGDELFIATLVAEAEQVDNLHVKTKIGEFEIENHIKDCLLSKK